MAKSKKAPEGENEEKQVSAIPNLETLKAVAESLPHVETFYVNEEGDYHFQGRPGYNPITREDILNG